MSWWCFDSSKCYNNIGPGPSFIAEIQYKSQQALLYEKEFLPGACYECGAMPAVTGTPVLCCAGCHLVYYCNKNCQRADWKVHKNVCKMFPVEMGKSIIVRKAELNTDCDSFHVAMWEIINSFSHLDGCLSSIFLNPRVCCVCREPRKEMLFNCRCCLFSYCRECHRSVDKIHSSQICDLFYGCAMINWYLKEHRQLQIPDGLLNEANLSYGINLEKVSMLAKYSTENWLNVIVYMINERLTFPLTIHHALRNLKLGKQRKCFSEITSLTIHIVHSTPMLDPRMWEFLLHQLPNLKILNLTFINRKMKLNTPYNSFLPLERCSDCKQKQRIINYNIQPIHYHEYFSSDDYVQPDVVAVFGTSYEMFLGRRYNGTGLNFSEVENVKYSGNYFERLNSSSITRQNIDKAERFTYQGNMTYSEHTVVILTDCDEGKLDDCVKSFHDARPIKVLLPVQINPAARCSFSRFGKSLVNVNSYLCCIQGNH